MMIKIWQKLLSKIIGLDRKKKKTFKKLSESFMDNELPEQSLNAEACYQFC